MSRNNIDGIIVFSAKGCKRKILQRERRCKNFCTGNTDWCISFGFYADCVFRLRLFVKGGIKTVFQGRCI